MKCKKLFEIIESLNDEYIQFLKEVCTIESPTDYKEGVDRVGKYFIEKARAKGWSFEVQEQKTSGNAVCITMNEDAKGEPICFSGHMDTVHPVGSFGENPVRCDDEKIYGPGVLDCKGGLTAAFMAMDALDRVGFKNRPIKLILQSDEENGSRNSNKTTVDFMCEKAKDTLAFLNCEPGSRNGHVISRKGICKFHFEIEGKAGHSAFCYNGASAILEAAHKIIKLEQYKDKDSITCNCGIICGGSAENTVPEYCKFSADFRYHTDEERQHIMKIAEKIASETVIAGTNCKVSFVSGRCLMPKTERNVKLFEKVRKIYLENNLCDVEMIASLGGADSADITQRGITCLEGFGMIGDNTHNLNEFAYLDSLILAAKRLAAVTYCI